MSTKLCSAKCQWATGFTASMSTPTSATTSMETPACASFSALAARAVLDEDNYASNLTKVGSSCAFPGQRTQRLRTFAQFANLHPRAPLCARTWPHRRSHAFTRTLAAEAPRVLLPFLPLTLLALAFLSPVALYSTLPTPVLVLNAFAYDNGHSLNRPVPNPRHATQQNADVRLRLAAAFFVVLLRKSESVLHNSG
eukprot:1373636-Pleurochrysis_carterae.AAC.4